MAKLSVIIQFLQTLLFLFYKNFRFIYYQIFMLPGLHSNFGGAAYTLVPYRLFVFCHSYYQMLTYCTAISWFHSSLSLFRDATTHKRLMFTFLSWSLRNFHVNVLKIFISFISSCPIWIWSCLGDERYDWSHNWLIDYELRFYIDVFLFLQIVFCGHPANLLFY